MMVSHGDPRSEAGEGQAASENSLGDELKQYSRNQEQEGVELERYCLPLRARGSQTPVLFPFCGRLCPWFVFFFFLIYYLFWPCWIFAVAWVSLDVARRLDCGM